MKITLCLILIAVITGSSKAFPQYGGNVQTDAEVAPQVEEISQQKEVPFVEEISQQKEVPHFEEISQKEVPHVEEISQIEVIPDVPEGPAHDVHPEHLEDSKDPEIVKETILSDLLGDPEDPQQSEFNKEQQEKLQKYWWKVSGIFSGSDKDVPSDIEHGVGVGGPFTPQQSKFCEVGFDCVPHEICVDGTIALHGQTILQQRIKPTNYETNQCGQEGNICCKIPEEILVAHQESIGTVDIVDDKIETHQPHGDPHSPVDSVSSINEHGENYDPSLPLDPTKVREEGKIDTAVPDKPVETVIPNESVVDVDPYEPAAPIDPHEPVASVDPHEPVASIDPHEPVAPIDPHEPVAPVDSHEPAAPIDPHKPVAPVDAHEPVAPIDPHKPVAAVDPYEPATSVDPHKPVKPFDPNEPVAPVVVDTDIQTNKEDGKHGHTGTDGGEIPVPPVDTSTVIKNDNPRVGGYGPSVGGEAEDPLIDPALDPGHGVLSPLVGDVKVEKIGDIDACGHASYRCVPYFQCAEGVINLDGTGLLDVRIKPRGVCENPEFPNVPGVCCLKPGYEPTPSPLSLCPNHQDCLPLNNCPSEEDFHTDGSGQLDLRTGHKKCQAISGEPGICCNRPVVSVENCPEKSACVSKLECFGQALNDANKFTDYVNTGTWTHCSKYSDGVCCLQPDILEGCPGKSKCILAGQCSGQAIDSSGNIVKYPSNGLWHQCSLGTSFGICCILPEPVVLDKCPGKSICLPSDQCNGQAIDGSGKFVDYVSSGSWSHCLIKNANGVCCASLPSRLVDACPLQSVCLRPEQCIGKALDASNNFNDYSKDGLWSHCSEYDGGVCCQNPKTPIDPGFLEPAPLCGIRNYNIDERITSSKVPNEAKFGEFPWQSIIFYQNYTFVCGATLVSNNFVITAAHCVDGIKPQDIKIRFGEWIVSNVEEVLPYVDRNVIKIHIHPEFNPKNVHKDFAVIELDKPIKYQYHINSVCLPNQGYMVKAYTQCFTTGWGKDSFEGTFQSTLKKIDLPFIEHEKCQNLLRKTRLGKYFRLDHSFNCAGGEENKDACYGDGGGPLVCKDKASSQYHLIGITSWGIGCGQKDTPGVYANVPEYSNWIKNIIKVQGAEIPEQFKESFAPLLEEPIQDHQEQHKQGLEIEDIPEQVKQEPHHQPEHIETIPEQPAPSYGK